MYFFTVVAFAILPFLGRAVPVSQKSSRTQGSITIPLSKRSSYLNPNGSVNHDILKAGERHTMARFEQALISYERNTGEIHPLALKRGHSNERRNASNSFPPPVVLTDHSNVLWTGEIEVGTPPKTFSVAFDTAITDTFLFDPSCLVCQCNGSQVYDISVSSTGTNLQSTAMLKSGENSVVGNVVSDTVVLGGFAAVDQPMVIATSVDPAFQCQNFSAEGMVGLGFKDASYLGKDSVFGNLITDPNGPLFDGGGPGFAFSFSQTGPELTIGRADPSKFKENVLPTVNLTSPALWQIRLDSVSVNGANIEVAQDVILDTSSVFIAGDLETISNIYSNIPFSSPIPNSNQWTIPCDTPVMITVNFSGNVFEIFPASYVLGPFPAAGPNLCMGGFSTAPSPVTWTMGTVLMRDVFILFSRFPLSVSLGQSSDV